MAPELFQDGSTHSSAADLWALGCVLYECAAGHPPFVSTSLNQLVNDILTKEPAPLPSKATSACRLAAVSWSGLCSTYCPLFAFETGSGQVDWLVHHAYAPFQACTPCLCVVDKIGTY